MSQLPDNWKDIFRAHVKNLKVKGKNALGLCPFHDDNRDSFSVNIETSQWICFAGCGKGNYYDFKRMIESPLPIPVFPKKSYPGLTSPKKLKPLKIYTYTDQEGIPRYEVLRMEQKNFIQRKIGGSNMEGVEHLPYRLDALWKRSHEVLWWVEGEKDVESLEALNLLSSTSSGGANAWKDTLALKIPNDLMVVLPDQDMPGQDYASKVINASMKQNKTILHWDTPTKDISDYLGANPIIQAGELKLIVWQKGDFFFSKEDPFIYCTKRGIKLQPWGDFYGDRHKFLSKQCQAVYDVLGDFLDPHHGVVVEDIDIISKSTKDSETYLQFCHILTHLIMVKEFYEAFFQEVKK